MSDCSREFRRTETLDDVISGYEVCMDERVMEADSWLSAWAPQAGENFHQQLIYDNNDVTELLQVTRTNVQAVTLAVAQQLNGVEGFPAEASQAMCDSWHQPDLAGGHEYIHRWTRDTKLVDGLEAGFDWYVLKNAFDVTEVPAGKRIIRDFASSFGRQAMEMAFDEQVYQTANAQRDYKHGWKIFDTYMSQNPTGVAARRGFDRYIFEAAKAQKARSAAHLIIETYASDDPQKRRQMLDNLQSNVLILPRVGSRRNAACKKPAAQTEKVASVSDLSVHRAQARPWFRDFDPEPERQAGSHPDDFMPDPDNAS